MKLVDKQTLRSTVVTAESRGALDESTIFKSSVPKKEGGWLAPNHPLPKRAKELFASIDVLDAVALVFES